MPSTQMLSVCVGIFAVILFSGTFPATKLALELYSPIHATCLRSSCASLFAIIFLVLVKLKNQSKQKKFNSYVSSEHTIKEMLELFFVGVMLVFGFPGAVAFALAQVSSSYSAVVLAMLPLCLSAAAVIIAKERPPILFWVCSFIAAFLVMIFMTKTYIFKGGSSNLNTHNIMLGNLWLLVACVCAAVGYTKSASLNKRMSGFLVISRSLYLTAPISFFAAILMWPAELAVADAMKHNSSFLGIIYLGLFSMFIGNCLWSIALSKGGISKIGQLQFLQPFMTLLISFWLLNEIITSEMILFAASVTLAVIIGQQQRIREKLTPN